MAILDVVRCEMQNFEFCKKFQSNTIKMGSQLVVYPSQIAIFVSRGKICDIFEQGTYTLQSDNLPILSGIINIPYGGDTPFPAEVWFINLTSKLDLKWGTSTPIQLEDPRYGIIVPVRAYGQYGVRIVNPQLFLTTLVGTMNDFSDEKINDYFRGQILLRLSQLVSAKITQEKICTLEMNNYLLEMSDYCKSTLNFHFVQYGIELTTFQFISINVPADDDSVKRLKMTKDAAAHINVLGQDAYRMERGFTVLETAASNNGIGGGFVAAGAGIGLGTQMGQITANAMQSTNTPPPVSIKNDSYFVIIDGKQIGGQSVADINIGIQSGLIKRDTLVWNSSLPSWMKAENITELSLLFPPKIP